MEPQIESRNLPFSSHYLGRKVKKRESLFLTFPLNQGRGKALRVEVWCLLSDKLSLEDEAHASLELN